MEKPVSEAVAAFVRAVAQDSEGQGLLVIPGWREADWEALFSYADRIRVASGDVLIRKEAAERALYFLVSGVLEVTAVLSSHSLGPIAKIHPGTPRSAKVWAVADSELYRLDFADYERFATAHPRQTCDLLFAIGRVVALRLRHSNLRPSKG
jgi:CRP-like cAMP-binding protein